MRKSCSSNPLALRPDLAQAVTLMQACWTLADATTDPKVRMLADAAGNCLESTFCHGSADDLALSAILAALHPSTDG